MTPLLVSLTPGETSWSAEQGVDEGRVGRGRVGWGGVGWGRVG